jgi:HPt (histidine-containing phosphotransfer) domain-containing protein
VSLFHVLAHPALLTEKMPAAVPALAHTLKGSAPGIGAHAVARAAVPAAMLRLDRAVEVARPAITAMLAHSDE